MKKRKYIVVPPMCQDNDRNRMACAFGWLRSFVQNWPPDEVAKLPGFYAKAHADALAMLAEFDALDAEPR